MVSTLTGITAQALLHRYYPAVYIALIAVLGCVAGWLTSVMIGFWLASPVAPATAPPAEQDSAQIRQLSDYQVILDRNIFNPTGGAPAPVLADNDTAAPPGSSAAAGEGQKQKISSVAAKDLILIGTIAAGADSLAVLRDGKETRIFNLGDEIEDGVSIVEISRNTVTLASRDGSRQILTLADGLMQAVAPSRTVSPRSGSRAVSSGPAAAPENDAAIQQVGDNRWVIPQDVVDQARGNFNELLKQARMEPRIIDGRTDGFVVRMIRPDSLLAHLGLRVGDVVKGINNVQLNSPEKALLIFQQLREARTIRIDLLRSDQPMTFEYETN